MQFIAEILHLDNFMVFFKEKFQDEEKLYIFFLREDQKKI